MILIQNKKLAISISKGFIIAINEDMFLNEYIKFTPLQL
jgi:hypothetical protein